jgi:choline dehydrogenase-like flavoprotein
MWNDPVIRRVLVEIQKTGTSSDELTRRFMESVLAWATTDRVDPQASPEERMSRFYAFSGMGRGEKPGVLKLLPHWRHLEAKDDPAEKLFVKWSSVDNSPVLKKVVDGMRKLAGEIDAGGAKRIYTPTWDFNKPENSTAVILHPLGGCTMGNNIESGVVDSYGQVFWNDGSSNRTRVYPDLFVIDGSILPEPPGVNPTMTIAAIAFRAAEKIVGANYLPKT